MKINSKILIGVLIIVLIVTAYLLYINFWQPSDFSVGVPTSVQQATQQVQQEIDFQAELNKLRTTISQDAQFMLLRKHADLPVQVGPLNKGEIFPARPIQ